MTGIPPHDLPRILAARDDLAALQQRVRERQAFPQSRGMQGLDRVLSRACDGPRRLEHLIGGAIGAGALLILFGWALGRR